MNDFNNITYLAGQFFAPINLLDEQKMNNQYSIILENFEAEQLSDQNISISFVQPLITFDTFKMNENKNVEYKVKFGFNLKCPLFFKILVDGLEINRNVKWSLILKIKKNDVLEKTLKLNYP